MSQANGNGLCLEGTGAAYVRVSDDDQDTERQYAAIKAFEKRHGVTIPRHHWFKDEGWARDQADKRPDFQRLMKLVEAGGVQWIVVDALDRFGMKNAKQLFAYLFRLEEAGCKLYDAGGKEWTGEDDSTEITAWVEGKNSAREQRSKSHRVLGGKVEKAGAGEWQGGPVRLGFDVACYDRETGAELWRVVFEGRDKRLKVYPDGRTERFDGQGNFPRFQEKTQVLRVAPSNDRGKIDAAVSVFERYATESISPTALARYLNGLGFRNSYGGMFQGPHVEAMLEDPIYLGYYTYNRRHSGKFHRWASGRTVLELNYGEKQSKNDRADWVQSRRLFDPLVGQRTWDAVQRKLGQQSRRGKAPRSAALYLAGLVYCGNCGKRMFTGSFRKTTKHPRKDGYTGERYEYFCSTYFKGLREGWRAECSCLRNGVFQDVLEGYVGRYLEETGRRLELLTGRPESDHLTDRLEAQEQEHWQGFRDGIDRLICYIALHRPQEYAAIAAEHADDPSMSPDDFVARCVACYRASFDPAEVGAEVERLEAEHTALMGQWADLPTPRAKEKARERFAELEARIEELRRQQQDAAGVVEQHRREMYDLQLAVVDARRAMRSEASERAFRQRAEALRAIIQRIECTFTATGQTGAGWGKKNSRLVKVTIYPVVGEPVEFSGDSKGTLMYSSAHSCM